MSLSKHRPLRTFLSLMSLAVIVAARCPEEDGTVVVFGFRNDPSVDIKVLVQDSATIDAARRYVLTGRGPRIPIGRIERGAGIDSRYPFHFLPAEIRLTELATEICDGRLMRTAREVDAFIAGAGDRYCPWTAYPKAVEDR